MKNKRIKIILASLLLTIIAVPSVVYGYNYRSYKTNLKHAERLLNDEQYADSIEKFLNLKSSKFSNDDSAFIDSNVKLAAELKQSKESFESGVNLINEKKYIEAINDFKNVKNSDKKRYGQAQEKIKEASDLYIADNITKAKAEATNKQYDNALNILETILKFDSNNKETINLKDEYNLESQKIKDEEEAKKQAEENAKKDADNQAFSQTSENQYTDTSNSSLSNETKSTSVPSNNSGYTVKYNNEGWFKVNLNSGVPTPEGFGIMSMGYSVQPNGIYYRFVGNNVQYEITLHLPTGDVKDSGNSTNDGFISASLSDVPRNQSINIDISATYKGETYTASFSRVINSLY